MTHSAYIKHDGYLLTGRLIDGAERFCPCCQGNCYARDDMADMDTYPLAFINSVAKIYGAGVCNGCMDDHVETDSGTIAHKDKVRYVTHNYHTDRLHYDLVLTEPEYFEAVEGSRDATTTLSSDAFDRRNAQ